jgi:hypothetical protein
MGCIESTGSYLNDRIEGCVLSDDDKYQRFSFAEGLRVSVRPDASYIRCIGLILAKVVMKYSVSRGGRRIYCDEEAMYRITHGYLNQTYKATRSSRSIGRATWSYRVACDVYVVSASACRLGGNVLDSVLGSYVHVNDGCQEWQA